MKCHFKQSLLLLITLFFCCKIYSLNLLDTNVWFGPKIDTRDLNYIETTGTETFISSTVTHEDHVMLTQTYHNHETGREDQKIVRLDYSSFNDFDISSPFDCRLPVPHDSPQTQHYGSTQSSDAIHHDTDHFSDHFKDSAVEQRKQDVENNHAETLQHNKQQSIQNRKHTIKLDKVLTGDEFEAAVIVPDINSYFQQLSYSLAYRFKEKAQSFSRKKTLAELQAKPNFVNTILLGEMIDLLKQVQSAELSIAEAAFNTSKKIWPYKRDRTFLNAHSYSTKELKFLKLLCFNPMKIIEVELITRQDYIQKHADSQSLATIQAHTEKCLLLQQQGNRTELCKEVERLSDRVNKKFGKEDFADTVCFAKTRKILLDPITTKLSNIAHLPSLEKARNELQHLEIEIADHLQQRNITLTSEAKKWIIENYGFDIREAAHQCYMSRTDYVQTPENQTTLSDPISCIVSNIKDKSLHMAHTELVHLKQQVSNAFAEQNITDPVAQKECLIKNFGTDVVAHAQSTYQNRPDILNLIKLFNPVDVSNGGLHILETNTTYESVCDGFQILTDQVLENARLCELECLPHVENHILDSLQVMREPKNGAEFIFHTTIVDHLLTDLQCQAHAVVTGEPTIWERIPGLFVTGLVTFFKNINPIELAIDSGYLAYHAGCFAGTAAGNAVYKVGQELLDPIGTTQQSLVLTAQACEYIYNISVGTCDAISGAYYLPAEERLQRLESSYETAGEIYKHIESQITAETIVQTGAKIAAAYASGKIISKVGTYLNEIDALTKISHEAKVIVQSMKNAVQEHPAFVTAEGVVLKMSNGMKNTGNAIQESAVAKNIILKVANMEEFFELPFGQILNPHSLKTSINSGGQFAYRLTENIPGTRLKKGYYYYLDNLHKDHLEVFNKRKEFIGVYNLDGTFNLKKFEAAAKKGRHI